MWWKAVFQPKVKLNIFYTAGWNSWLRDNPKLCWFGERKKIPWALLYVSRPQLINPSKTPLFFSLLPVHLSKFSFAVITLNFNSSTTQNNFAPELIQFLRNYTEEKACVSREEWLGFRESPWSKVRVRGWEPFPSPGHEGCYPWS